MDHPTPARLERVTKRFRTTVALDEVSVRVEAGETVALLGPNGAGKTTAVRALLGLIAPDSGRATLFGADPRRTAARRRAGAMLQVAGLPATLTVAEHVALFRAYYPRPLAAAEALALAGLTGLERRCFGDLSGGQKQRLAFALAICGDPDVLFLDEPSASLDVEARLALWSTIRAVVARGKSILLTTHDLAEAQALADRVVVLAHGRIVADGTTADVRAAGGGGTLIRCRSGLEDIALLALPGVRDVQRAGDAIVLRAADADAAIRALYACDPGFALLEVAETGLEAAFLSLIRPEAVS